MSFSIEVKNELCQLSAQTQESAKAELSAMLLLGRAFERGNCLLQTENRGIAEFIIDYIEEFVSPILSLYTAPNPRRRGGSVYSLTVDRADDRREIISAFLQDDPFDVYRLADDRTNCSAFLRGAFLVCGSMNDPHKEYHLELVPPSREWADRLSSLLSGCGLPVKAVKRTGRRVLYLKECESIEDFLTLVGATHASLSMMGIEMMKDVRNKVNRVTNCETANIGKTANAAAKQIADIRLIVQNGGLEQMADGLQEVARARMQNPEMSLGELAEEIGGGISRSGVNHRLCRIAAIADGYRKA